MADSEIVSSGKSLVNVRLHVPSLPTRAVLMNTSGVPGSASMSPETETVAPGSPVPVIVGRSDFETGMISKVGGRASVSITTVRLKTPLVVPPSDCVTDNSTSPSVKAS